MPKGDTATTGDAPTLGSARPDALLLPDDARWGAGNRARGNAICDFAEPILGGAAYFRKHFSRSYFVTRSPHDSYLFPLWHAKGGKDRYRWEDKGDGVRHGFLVDGAPTAAEIEAGNMEAFG